MFPWGIPLSTYPLGAGFQGAKNVFASLARGRTLMPVLRAVLANGLNCPPRRLMRGIKPLSWPFLFLPVPSNWRIQ